MTDVINDGTGSVTPSNAPLPSQGLQPTQTTPNQPTTAQFQPQQSPVAQPNAISTSTGNDRPAAPVALQVAEPPANETRGEKLQRLLRRYVGVTELVGAYFTHRGFCTKCGWQTMQHSAANADALVVSHVQQHWHDVAGEL